MNFYWVNIGASYKEVTQNSFLWAPTHAVRLKDKNDPSKGTTEAYLSYWDNVKEVKKGDVIFCNYNRTIEFVAIAKKDAFSAPRPTTRSFRTWHQFGTQVDVDIIYLSTPLSINGYISEMFTDAYNVDSKPKVFNANGAVFQGYMAAIPDAAGIELLRLTDSKEELIVAASDKYDSTKTKKPPKATTKKSISEARIGQGDFRNDLIKLWKKCLVTGVTNRALLIASHIYPWAKSDHDERLDPYNGLLLAPHIDRLFDRGLIGFDDSGQIILSKRLSLADAAALKIHGAIKIPIKLENIPYLVKHRALFKL
jgi:putative restriction endonuclease